MILAKSSMKSKEVFCNYRKSQLINDSLFSVSSVVSDRLLNSHKKTREKIEAKRLENMQKEEEKLKNRPEMSSGSKKIIKSKQYIPIYSGERLQQIVSAKKEKVGKLREESKLKQEKKEEEERKEIPYSGQNIKNVELCFDPNQINPEIYQEKKKPLQDTTEDMELKSCCSFHPRTDKKSHIMFSQANVNKSRL